MLGLLRLDPQQASVRALAEAIPLNFHNDITWGLALAEGNGAFENYRIRMRLPGASDMQRRADDINGLRSRAGQQGLHLRIGIHWGEVVIGNVGTAERLDWTAIGDVANTASRIEKGCRPGAILASEAVKKAVEATRPGEFEFGETFGLQVKGKQDALTVCHVSPASHHDLG